VLVADDDLGITEVVTRALEDEGYKVIVAHDGEAALAAAVRERPAALVTDIVMPRLDGIALARRVAALPGPPVPVILMSAHWDAAPRPDVPFLPKPFDLKTLLTMVRHILGLPSPSPSHNGSSTYLLEAYCQRCSALQPATEQEPADLTAQLTCTVCRTPLLPPIVIARRAVSRPG
jgi:DNA-binding response OmpR family regulator